MADGWPWEHFPDLRTPLEVADASRPRMPAPEPVVVGGTD